jgi:hypothetical protein
LLARLGISQRTKRVTSLEVVPIATQNRIVSYQPRPLAPDELGWLDPLLAGSRARGTDVSIVDGRLQVAVP